MDRPADAAVTYIAPERVTLLPVFFVPTDRKMPDKALQDKLVKHIKWTQRSYRKLLGGRDSFTIAKRPVLVYRARMEAQSYLERPEDGMPWIAGELLSHLKLNRFNAPYIFVTIFVNPLGNRPAGRGQPFNGGLNTGGGIALISSQHLEGERNFQSTMEHEIGHSLGLPHANVRGHDMKTSDSLMSYNQKHTTKGFTAAKLLSTLIPEDIRFLAMNRRVFGNQPQRSSRSLTM